MSHNLKLTSRLQNSNKRSRIFLWVFSVKKIKYKYSIHLGDSDYKSVVTLNGIKNGNKIDWSWNYSPDLEPSHIGLNPALMGIDTTIMAIADGSIAIDELDKGKIHVGLYGECRVKKYNV